MVLSSLELVSDLLQCLVDGGWSREGPFQDVAELFDLQRIHLELQMLTSSR